MHKRVESGRKLLLAATAALALWGRAEAASNAPACPTCQVGYPYASTNPLTSVSFNESEVLRAYNTNVVDLADTIRLWYNDEHALTLGIHRVIVKTRSGSTTTDYPITALAANPGSAVNPLVGSTNVTGDQAGTDLSDRPMFPALFITDTTQDATSRAGDWQFGGRAYPPHAIFGTWKGAVRTVDYTKNPPDVSIQPDADPAKNNWNLDGGDPAPDGLRNEGYGAEVRWNVADLKLLPGHSYRLYFMVHDGDQNKAGGDSGQGCVTICMPCLPLNVTGLTNVTTCAGGNVVFSNSVIGGTGPFSYPFTFQWYRGATPLAGETNSSLRLNNVGPGAAGTYTVVVTGSCGAPVTNSATLTVNQAPIFVTPPANQISVVGSNATFSANVSGTGLTYQWYFRGAVVGTSNVLTLNNLTTNQAGTYCLVASSPCGAPVTNCATLTVNEGMRIITPPMDHTNCPGDNVSFSVTANGTALTYQWYFGTAILVGQTNNILALTNITAASAGNYCVVVNAAAGGPVTNCAALTVNQNVIVTMAPTNQVVCQNGTVQFIVNATGTALTYQWYLGNLLLNGQTGSTLVLTNVSLNAAGVYSVVVRGACAPPVTNSATLTVNQNIVIVTPPVNQTGMVGSNVTFTVVATGTGLTYQWFFNGVLISTNSTLPLNNLSTNQAGTYCVVVSGACGGPLTNCVTLNFQNRPPVANNDAYTIAEDTTLNVPASGVLTNDTDADGDRLTAILVNTTTNGTLTLSSNGGFVYRPNTNFNGLDHFTYRASDGSLLSGVATVTITVTPVNDRPIAVNDDSYTTPEDTTLTVAPGGVLLNDIDVDGDVLSAILVSTTTNGVLSLNADGGFVYRPNTNFNGLDHFTYRAFDGALTSGVAVVTITVTPVNDRPTAVNDDGFQVLEDHTLTIAAPGVLANDTDVDGDALRAFLVSGPTNGVVTLNTNGSFTYRPVTNYFGPDRFTYVANDGRTNSLPATVSIAVIAVNDPPGFTGSGDVKVNQNAGAQSTAWARNISPGPANESDQTVNFIVSNDSNSLFSVQPAIAPNGTLTYTPAPNRFGVATVHVVLKDNGGTANGGVDTSAETVFHITVNAPPVVEIVSPINGVALISPATFSVIASASDPDGTVTNVTFLVNGVFRTNIADAPFYFIMSNTPPGPYQFRAIATDNCGLTATSAPVSIEVITNAIVAVGPIALNRQNGLFEQFVTVSNRSSETWAKGVRLLITLSTNDIAKTNKVWNPTGTNSLGTPYIDNTNAVPPGGDIMFLIQYYVPNIREVPNPMLLAVPLPYDRSAAAPKIMSLHSTGEDAFAVNFTSVNEHFYFLQFSDDLVHWQTESTAMAGTGHVMVAPQSSPDGKRFYRVLMVP